MTDLISSLADSIIALNNASPRLPTKAQVEDAIAKFIPRATDQCTVGHPNTPEGDHKWHPCRDPLHFPSAPERCLCGATRAAQPTIIPLPYKDVSPTLKQLANEVRDGIKKAYFPELEKNGLYARLKDMEPTIAVGQADQPCRGSATGTHYWTARCSKDDLTLFYRCPCGATKTH